jgi:hypothetical protein
MYEHNGIGPDGAFISQSPNLVTPSDQWSASLAIKCSRTCQSCVGTGRKSRRAFLQVGFAALASAFFASPRARADANPVVSPDAGPVTPSTGAGSKPDANTSVCKNCSGSGKVPCDLCSGTGFWRALARNDVNQKYQGVVCPECEGVGTLTCPVCLGTGEGNIRGLLRRRRIEPGPGRILQRNM